MNTNNFARQNQNIQFVSKNNPSSSSNFSMYDMSNQHMMYMDNGQNPQHNMNYDSRPKSPTNNDSNRNANRKFINNNNITRRPFNNNNNNFKLKNKKIGKNQNRNQTVYLNSFEPEFKKFNPANNLENFSRPVYKPYRPDNREFRPPEMDIYNQGVDFYSPLILNDLQSEISQEKVIYLYDMYYNGKFNNSPSTLFTKRIITNPNHPSDSKYDEQMDDSVFEKMSQVSDESDSDELSKDMQKDIQVNADVNMQNEMPHTFSSKFVSKPITSWHPIPDAIANHTQQFPQSIHPPYSVFNNLKNTMSSNLPSRQTNISTSTIAPAAPSMIKSINYNPINNIPPPPTSEINNSKENSYVELNNNDKTGTQNIDIFKHNINTDKINTLALAPLTRPPLNGPSKESLTDLRFKREKKLALILDLDNTLLHACQANKLNCDIDLMDFLDANNNPELFKFVLSFMPNVDYYLKLRPFVREFLDSLLPYYELSVFTHATSEYADAVLSILDPDHSYFGDRVATRLERNNTDEPKLLSRLYPDLNPRFVLVFDDRVDIWQDLDRDQIMEAECYQFLTTNQSKLMKLYPMQGSEVSSNFNVTEPVIDYDQHLDFLTEIFINIHKEFYSSPVTTRVGTILSNTKNKVLENVGIFFTGFMKEGMKGEPTVVAESENLHREMAKAFGANICSNITDPNVTHIVALRSTTENYKKCKEKSFDHLKKVHYLWLYDCIGTWSKSDESLFEAEELTAKYKYPIMPSQEHWTRRSRRGYTPSSSLGVKALSASNSQSTEQLPTRTYKSLGPNSTGSVVVSPFERVFITSPETNSKSNEPPALAPSSNSSNPSTPWIPIDSNGYIPNFKVPNTFSSTSTTSSSSSGINQSSLFSPPPYSSVTQPFSNGFLSPNSNKSLQSTYIPSNIFETTSEPLKSASQQ